MYAYQYIKKVDLDPRFINQTELHMLDLSNANIRPINVDQTYEGDWLLENAITDNDDVCDTFPSPYDNDYRGRDPVNPNDIPSRFVPDQPVSVPSVCSFFWGLLLPLGRYLLGSSSPTTLWFVPLVFEPDWNLH